MPLTVKTVRPGADFYPLVEELYLTAFPEQERLPLAWMNDLSDTGRADFQAYFDGAVFCGFSYSLKSETCYYLLFLAVAKDQRSKGYGSAILTKVAQEAGGRTRILVIEPLDQSATNYGQRLRRLAFYQSNAYHLTSHYYYEDQEAYQVMADRPKLSPADLASFRDLASLIESTGLAIGLD